jgi:hypothetical protein
MTPLIMKEDTLTRARVFDASMHEDDEFHSRYYIQASGVA